MALSTAKPSKGWEQMRLGAGVGCRLGTRKLLNLYLCSQPIYMLPTFLGLVCDARILDFKGRLGSGAVGSSAK